MTNWRQGYDAIFPTSEYVKVLTALTQKKSQYGDLQKMIGIKSNILGIKLQRMKKHGLIKKEGWGVYYITPFGSKVLKAYNAYMEIMKT